MRRGWLLVWIGLILASCRAAPDATPKGDPTERVARTQVERGPVTVKVEVSPVPCRLSDEPQLVVTIEHDAGVEVQFPPFGTAFGNFIIRDFREPLPQTRNQRHVRRQVYTLEPVQSGPSQIDPIVVTFVDRRAGSDPREHRVETEALTVQVYSPLDQGSPSLDQLKGPQDPVPLPSPVLSSWWWFAGAGLFLASGMAVWYFRRRRQALALPQPTARELAMRELEALWESDTPREEVKVYYVELTGIVRRYIERTTNVHAPEQTTAEFLHEIGRGMSFSRDERQRLKDFLESADLVKFAAHQPDFADVTESFQRARRFVGWAASHQEQPA